MRRFLICFFAAGLLVGCEASLKGPSAELSLPKIKIDNGGGFCPPGQAKKGNC